MRGQECPFIFSCEKRLIEEAVNLNRIGKSLITVIDDAHLMEMDTLRRLRLLFEEFPKNHNIILIGHPVLLSSLALSVNADIKSRVTYSAIAKRISSDQMKKEFKLPVPVNNIEEIISRIQSVSNRLKELDIKQIGLFGSFVKNTQTPSCDIDILAEFKPEHHSFDNFMEVSFLLEDLLGRPVELLTPEALSPYIGPNIKEELKLVPLAA